MLKASEIFLSEEIDSDLRQKYDTLVGLLQGFERAAVALSGGVDSSLLAVVAQAALGSRLTAFTIHSPIEDNESCLIAEALSRQFGFAHLVIDHNDLDDPNFATNLPDRCYHCKSVRFKIIKEKAAALGIEVLLEGTNADDGSDYRPGKKAVKELGGRSPLAEVGLTKAEIRTLARLIGIPIWNRPSSPCLASRFPYGMAITRPEVLKIEAAEGFMKRLGFNQLRVRHHGELARIEVPQEDMEKLLAERAAISAFFRELGFHYITLDLSGFRTGSLNEVLPAALVNNFLG